MEQYIVRAKRTEDFYNTVCYYGYTEKEPTPEWLWRLIRNTYPNIEFAMMAFDSDIYIHW